MHYLNPEQSVYSFSKNHQPVLTINSGEKVVFRTFDCFTNQVKSEADLVTTIDFSRVNPATGPVFIEEAAPGDVLKVEIHDIKVRDWGVICTLPDVGVLKHRAELRTKIVSIENSQTVHFNEDILLQAVPMIGVIGCAPAGDEIPCGYSGDHGGNMDNHIITKGSTVYLPIHVPGALFALGDIHASMGDGEICGTGVETAAEVETTISVLKGVTLPRPFVETKESWYTVASADDLSEAIRKSSEDMQDMLVKKWDLSPTDAFLLMSVAGDVQICQCCATIDVIARFKMPKLQNLRRLI